MRKIKKNNLVTLPIHYTFGSRLFRVKKVFPNNDLQLEFLTGKKSGEIIERFSQKEVIKLT